MKCPRNIVSEPRRALVFALLCSPAFARFAHAQPALPLVEVWKSPTCGCCNDWIKHLEQAGFTVKPHDTGNNPARARLGMPNRYASCHTAQVAGYVVEGHVPAADIKRLLAERPKALGLAVPDMPIGSPGMDGPAYGNRVDPYEVLLIGADGSARTFATYGKEKPR